jgi:hypothetical protein
MPGPQIIKGHIGSAGLGYCPQKGGFSNLPGPGQEEYGEAQGNFPDDRGHGSFKVHANFVYICSILQIYTEFKSHTGALHGGFLGDQPSG